MEKTVLYSKKHIPLANSLSQYEQCPHEHCQKLLNHVKFLSNLLTDRVVKDDNLNKKSKHMTNNINNKYSLSEKKIDIDITEVSVYQEIEMIKRNYTKLKKQLQMMQLENDQLYDENQQYKRRLEKLESSHADHNNNNNNKEILELTVTKCNQISVMGSKSSFYNKQNQPLLDHGDNVQMWRKMKTKQQSQWNELNGQYNKLKREYKILEVEMMTGENKGRNLKREVEKLREENEGLRRLIKMRNQIQERRHNVVDEFKRMMDEMEA